MNREQGKTMPTYVVLANWTDQGIAGFDRSDERVFATTPRSGSTPESN